MRLLLLILLLLPIVAKGQLINVEPINIEINYDKTMHLIFPSNINYFDAGDKVFICDKPKEAPNVLRIKASLRDFTERSNLTVVTNDGKYHSFIVNYKEDINFSAIDVAKIEDFQVTEVAQVKGEDILLCENKSSHLIFPSSIVYVDYGNSEIEVKRVVETENIIRAKAVITNFKQTNISVVTKNKGFYTFDVAYSSNPSNFSFVVTSTEDKEVKNESIALLQNDKLNELAIEDIIKKIESRKRSINHLGVKKGSIHFHVDNIFVRGDKLYIDMEMENNSNLDYDIELLKFYIDDKKKTEKTISQSEEQLPLFSNKWKKNIVGKTKNRFIFAFDKFTIPDAKYFIIRFKEVNGGRDILFRLENKDIINAKPL